MPTLRRARRPSLRVIARARGELGGRWPRGKMPGITSIHGRGGAYVSHPALRLETLMLDVTTTVNGTVWPGIPGPFASQLLAMQCQFETIQWLPAAEILARQSRQLGRLSAHAFDTTAFYRRRLEKAIGLPPERASRVDEWSGFRSSRARTCNSLTQTWYRGPCPTLTATQPALHFRLDRSASAGHRDRRDAVVLELLHAARSLVASPRCRDIAGLIRSLPEKAASWPGRPFRRGLGSGHSRHREHRPQSHAEHS